MKWLPNRKVGFGAGFGMPIAVVLSWVLKANGVEMPDGVESAIGAIITGVIGYFVPNKEE